MQACNRKLRGILTALVAVATLSLAQAATYYVATDGDDVNGGSNPTNDALATLEKAVELAVDDDTILVCAGTYYLQEYTGVTITNAINLASVNESDVVIIKPKAVEGGYTGNRRLLIVDSVDAVVDGLTLAEAYANDNPQYGTGDNVGYALLLKAGTVTNCIITDSRSDNANHTVVVLDGVLAATEIRNTGLKALGGWYRTGTLYMTGGTATGCVVTNNQSRGRGTVYLDGSGAQLLDSEVSDNTMMTYEVPTNPILGTAGVAVYGGGLVKNCVIADNYANAATTARAYSLSGGVHLSGGAAKLVNCIVSGNTTVSGYAGGVYVNHASARVENCLIIKNRSLTGRSGGVYMPVAATLLNNTIFGNVAEAKTTGHGLYMTAGTAKNLVLYANGVGESALTGGNLERTGGTVSYSCVTPVTDANGTGNIEGRPYFADADNGNFQLLFGSPCRDSGETLAAITTDLANVSRPQGTGTDMGCYEAIPSTEPECLLSVVSGAQGPTPLSTVFTSLVSIATGILDYTWTTTDGVTTNSETVTSPSWSHTFTEGGLYDISLKILYSDSRTADYSEKNAVKVLPTMTYVALTGGHVWPFDTLGNASTNFQEAIAAVYATVESPGTVNVQPGVYGTANGLGVSEDYLVLLGRPVRLVGQGATATDTVIDGNQSRRLLKVASAGASVENLTLSRGANQAGAVAKDYGLEIAAGSVSGCIVTNGWSPAASSPEAMVLQSGGVITNTDICANRTASGNAWTKSGPTVLITGGTMANCRIFDNQGRNLTGLVYLSGAGTCLANSRVFGNTLRTTEYASIGSAGVSLAGGAQMVGCEITDNASEFCVPRSSAETSVGGVNLVAGNATVRDCIIRGNRAVNGRAGGVLMGANTVLANSLISQNTTGATLGEGGGVAMWAATARLLNCTLANNTNLTVATGQGLYLADGAVTNCIVYGNGPDATRFTTNNLDATGGTVAYTCAMPKPDGDNNLGADPLFKNLGSGDYHLRGNTLCRRAGVALAEVTTDLDGAPRKLGRPYDPGCYVVEANGMQFILR